MSYLYTSRPSVRVQSTNFFVKVKHSGPSSGIERLTITHASQSQWNLQSAWKWSMYTGNLTGWAFWVSTIIRLDSRKPIVSNNKKEKPKRVQKVK